MPTYEYKCETCGHLEEVFAKMSDPPPAACEDCGGTELVKVLFPVAVHYKGSGFYNTDYASKKGKSGDSGGDSSTSGGESGSGSSGGESSGSSGGDSSGSSGDSGSSSSSSSASSDA